MTDPLRRGEIPDVGADHKHIAMREIDKSQHAVNHRVPKRDQRVDRAERNAVDELLNELHRIRTWITRIKGDYADDLSDCVTAKFAAEPSELLNLLIA